MRNNRFMLLVTALFVALSTLLVAPSATAAGTSSSTGNDTLVVESVSYANDSATATNTAAANVKVNGATQLLWWFPDHNIKVSKKSLKKAPKIKVRYTSCAKQSKSIAKQAHGASVVIAKVGSQICNSGREGNIVGGFKWTVTKPAVLKWNKSLKLYQHVYDIVGGQLVKTCGNYMGGHVDQMYSSVIQVRYEADLEQESLVTANAATMASVTASKECPGGKVYATAGASATASASAWVYTKLSLMAKAVDAKKVEIKASLQSSVKAQAEAGALAKIVIECGTGTTPPPPSQQSPTVELGEKNDVDADNTAEVCADYNVPGSNTATLKFGSGKGAYPGGTTFTVSGIGKQCTRWRAPSNSEVPAGGYTETLSAVVRDNVTGLSATDTTPIRVNSTPIPPK